MGVAKYRPMDYLAPGVKFGGSAKPEMKPVTGLPESARRRASREQSERAFAIRRRMLEERVSLTTMAEQMGYQYDRWTKVMRGYVLMTMEDDARAHLVLNFMAHQRNEAARTREPDPNTVEPAAAGTTSHQ